MSSSKAFGGLFDIQSPPATYKKDQTKPSNPPTALELDTFTFGSKYNGPSQSGTQTPTGLQTPPDTPGEFHFMPMTPNELEMSRPPSPKRDEAVGMQQNWRDGGNVWKVLCCCCIYFGNGINDSAPGALIPYMEEHYNIGYAIVSTIFVGNAAGFILAAFFTNTILGRLGRAKTLMSAEVLLLVSYIMMVVTPPFPVVVIAFFLSGFGMAITLALNNVFCANMHPPTEVVGAAHGSYGIGGIIAPIIATALVSKGTLWSRFYFLPLGLRVVEFVFAAWAFWGYKEEQSATLLTALERSASRQAAGEQEPSKMHNLKLALKNRTTLIGALFIFAYQGAEVSISGWAISFLINYRGGDPSRVGYVTAGFWAGITLGRFVLTHLCSRIGEKRSTVGLIILSIVFQLLAWFIPNVIGDAIAVAILGLILGPVYPCGQIVFTKLLPRHVQTTAVGFIAGAGSSGGAVAPFLTGLLAQASGTWVLHPVCLGMYAVMLGCWIGLPKIKKMHGQ